MSTDKAIFFDIDGTIIDAEGYIPESAVSAIRTARSRGVKCIVNTGRPYSHIDPKVKAIGFDGFVCSCGQHIVINGETVRHTDFSPMRCREIADKVRECGLNAVYESENGCRFYFCRPPQKSLSYMKEQMAQRGFDVSAGVDDPDFGFDKFCVFAHGDSDLAGFLRFIEPDCTAIDREGNLFEIIKLGYSKERGLRETAEILGVPDEGCYAIGDSANDLPMLKCVRHSIAMGNAPDEVKKAAEYVTDALPDNGLANALSHFGLI